MNNILGKYVEGKIYNEVYNQLYGKGETEIGDDYVCEEVYWEILDIIHNEVQNEIWMIHDNLYNVIYMELNHRTSNGIWMRILSIAEVNNEIINEVRDRINIL